jgi:hypothetical protein
MEIIFTKKFTQKDFDAFNEKYFVTSLGTTDSDIIFNLEQLEWISAEEITFLFALMRQSVLNEKNVVVKMPIVSKKFKGDDDETIERRRISNFQKDVFGDDNTTTIEKLEETIEKYKYSIFVFSPDDQIKLGNDNSEKKSPRDNVIFEYGLFMGKRGRPNTFLMIPKDSYEKPLVHILTDIDGLNYKAYAYSGSDKTNIKNDVRNACDDIIIAIEKLKYSHA